MLNTANFADFKKFAPSKEVCYMNILYREVDVSQRDEGVVEEFSDEEILVDFVNAKFHVGEPVTPWLIKRINSEAKIISKKRIRYFLSAQVAGWRSLITDRGFFSTEKNYVLGDASKIIESKNEGFGNIDGKIFVPFSRNGFSLGGVGFFLSYLEPGNHGSFIFRALPKLLFFLESGVRVDYLIVPDVGGGVRDVLRKMGLGDISIISCKQAIGLTFEKLYVVDDFEEEGMLCSLSMDRIWRMNSPSFRPLKLRKKIYVSRRLNYGFRPKYRPLINEEEVENLLIKKGFEVLYPESLSFLKQMNEFGSASIVVGPSGSGMLNTVFAGAGAFVVDIESFTYTIAQHAKLYSSSFKNYGFVFGKYEEEDGPEPFRAWSVAIDDVDAAVTQAVDALNH